jgi:hypothetical protein
LLGRKLRSTILAALVCIRRLCGTGNPELWKTAFQRAAYRYR